MQQDPGSFRDKSGHVYRNSGEVLRTINSCYRDTWEQFVNTGLLSEMLEESLLVSFEDSTPVRGSWKTLKVEPIPFVSYPYEWSFSQLRDAALHTLELQSRALKKSFVLKDASAYNVQYVGVRPVFIDLLSFECWKAGDTWQAYRQYCSHFLAPLALAAKKDLRCIQLLRQWIDGIPLDLAAGMLPWRTRLSPGLFMHLVLHASLQGKYADPRKFRDGAKKNAMNLEKLEDIVESLRNTTSKLCFPAQSTEWGDYYTDTNYTDDATRAKLTLVEAVAKEHSGRLAVDLGANTGRFSRPLAKYFESVVSADVDPTAVDRHYCHLRQNGPDNILPLVLDLSMPSPSLGWACQERQSFAERCESDLLLALALCHHLYFTLGIPFSKISSFFASLLGRGGVLVCEFVPREDSQVQRMLCARDDVFDDYTLDEFFRAFCENGFREMRRETLPDSLRTLHVFQKVD